jgi:uncharacterized RDD family membrane protein YckC
MTNPPPPPPGSYPPPPPGNYPPPPPGGYGPPPQQGGYGPPPQQGGYGPPPQQQGGYGPPPQQGGYGAPPQQGGYPQPGGPGGALSPDSYTPWFTRVLAWLIDSIPIFIVVGIGQGIAIATGENVCTSSTYGYGGACVSTYSTIGVLFSGLASLLAFAYVIWNYGYKQGTTGSSIGKGIMKFKVVSEKTWQPIGFGMSIVRQLAHFVDAIICYIGYLFPLWDAKRQTLADKIMTTVCVPI